MTDKAEEQVQENFPEDFYPYDKEDVRQFYKQITTKIQDAYQIPDTLKFDFKTEEIDEVVFAGMGGSAIAGIVMRDYFNDIDSNFKITVANDYHLPRHISKKALIICVSYSGNTEETLSMFKDAQRKKIKIMSICSNGKLEEISNNYRVPLVKIPKRIHPRQAFPYLFFTAIKILEKIGKIETHEAIIKSLVKAISSKNFEKVAIELAKKLYKKRIFIYTSNRLEGIAYRWKTQFNENSKVPASYHFFPEVCHNELCQYMADMKDSHVVIFKTNEEERRMQKRIEITKKLMSKTCEVTELDITGTNMLTKIYTAIIIGDLTSYYLAIRYRRDPSDDSIIGELKKDLGPWIN
jgi:glucose/mannose-6-phosphate isomerase